MNFELLYRIRENAMLQFYLKTHSYWYKILRRDPKMIKEMTQNMKEEYKMTPSDKLNQISSKIEMVRTFFDVLN